MIVKIANKNDTKFEVLDQVARYTLNTTAQASDDTIAIDLTMRDGTPLTVSGEVIYIVSEETRKTIDVLRSKNNSLKRDKQKKKTPEAEAEKE